MKLTLCACCQQPGTNLDEHHISMRTAGNLNRTIHLCRKCHTYIHENQAWAKQHGFLDQEGRFAYERSYHEG